MIVAPMCSPSKQQLPMTMIVAALSVEVVRALLVVRCTAVSDDDTLATLWKLAADAAARASVVVVT